MLLLWLLFSLSLSLSLSLSSSSIFNPAIKSEAKSSGCVCGGRDVVVADDDASLETVVVDGLGLADVVVVVVDDALLEGAYDDVFSLSGNGLKTNFIFS